MTDATEKISEINSPEHRAEIQAQNLIDLEQIIPGVSPGAVMDAMEDPEAFAAIARGDLYVQLAVLRQRASHADFPNSMRMDYAKFLAKMGKVDNPVASTPFANLPMIQITFPGSGVSVQLGAATAPAAVRDEKDITARSSAGEPSDARASVAVLP